LVNENLAFDLGNFAKKQKRQSWLMKNLAFDLGNFDKKNKRGKSWLMKILQF